MQPSYAIAETFTLIGIEPHLITCEVDLSMQLPSISMVGSTSSLTQESKDRLRSAFINSSLEWPARKVTINLLPTNLPKWGSHFELAMAIAIYLAQKKEEVPFVPLAIGELSLSGGVRPCGWFGALSTEIFQIIPKDKNKPRVIFAHPDDLTLIENINPEFNKSITMIPVKSLKDLDSLLLNPHELKVKLNIKNFETKKKKVNYQTIKNIRNEKLAQVAAFVAIKGRFHAFLAGSHGRGKSMWIRGVCEALPELKDNQKSERNSLKRLLGASFDENISSKYNQPVVFLQTGVTRGALEGSICNNGQLIPGEFTRAHHGVLVADEMLEFHRDVIESFRQPIEEKYIRIQRAKFKTILPSDFQCLASTNLCPCGYFGTETKDCRCTVPLIRNYLRKCSGPILDRFDLVLVLGNPQNGIDYDNEVQELMDKILFKEHVESVNSNIIWNDLLTDKLPSYLSERGIEKIKKITISITQMDDLKNSFVQEKHLKLALMLRQNLESIIDNAIITSNYKI